METQKEIDQALKNFEDELDREDNKKLAKELELSLVSNKGGKEMEYTLTDKEVAEVKARGGDIAEAQEAKKKAWLEANPQTSRMEYTKGKCCCYVETYVGQKPKIHYCPLHEAALDLYEALEGIIDAGLLSPRHNVYYYDKAIVALAKARVE